MTAYEGKRSKEGCFVNRVDGEESVALPARLDLCAHSPTGFEWGYGGSGPAQLSLALLSDALDDEEQALRLHQAFKWEVIARLPEDAWRLAVDEVRATAQRLWDEQEAPVSD